MQEDMDIEYIFRIAGEPSKEIEDAVNQSIRETIDKLQPLFPNQTIQYPKVEYDLQGHTAGMANNKRIRLNLDVLFDKRYFEDMIRQTIPHEVCHVVDWQMHGSSSHGYRWKYLMHRIGLEPTRCHEYETVAARVRKPRPKPHMLYCACGDHPVTTTIYKRFKDGNAYRCRTCGYLLREAY